VLYVEQRHFVVEDSPCVGAITGGIIITSAILLSYENGSPVPQTPVSY
jgi:hypothetical protein